LILACRLRACVFTAMADAALTQAHQLAPDDTKILYALARVQLDEQKMPEAEANLRAYLKVRAEDATAHYGLGRLLHMLLRNDEAKAELQESIALRPVQSGSYYELGEVALEQNEINEAKSNYEKVLAVAPHHGGALTGMGVLAYRAKDYVAAEGYLKSAVLYASDFPRRITITRLCWPAWGDRSSRRGKRTLPRA